MGLVSGIECCPSAPVLAATIRPAPAALVQVRALALPSMLGAELRAAVAEVPYDVLCVVAPPEAVAPLVVLPPALGEALVFARGHLLGRIPAKETHPAPALVGLLRAGLSPWLARKDTPQWEDDEGDPFAVIGVAPTATLNEVRSAWRRALAEYHPDRYAGAGQKIRDVAASESQRINAAFRDIQRRFTR